MAVGAVIGTIVATVLPTVLQATRKPQVVDSTPDAPPYTGPQGFAAAFEEEKKQPNYKPWIIGGSISVVLLLIFLIMRKR